MGLNDMYRKYQQEKQKAQVVSAVQYNFQEQPEEEFDLTTFEGCLRGAKAGNAEAQLYVALSYEDGDGVEQDSNKAFQWFLKSANGGNADAQYFLAGKYHDGDCVEQDYDQAFEWYKKAAEQGHVDSVCMLGIYYKSIYHNRTEAIKWLTKAANLGDAFAQWSLGELYYSNEEYDKAFDFIKQSAASGDAAGLRLLGLFYLEGHVVEKSASEAIRLFTQSANQGNHQSSWKLGYMYDVGEDVKQNYSTAYYWYKKSFDQGSSDAPRNIGILYENGEGVYQSNEEALKWYRIAEERGNEIVRDDIRRIQIGSSNKYLSRETLIRDIAQCARRSYISEDMHLTSAGLYGSRITELKDLLFNKYKIAIFSSEMSKCKTVNDLIKKIGKASGYRIQSD